MHFQLSSRAKADLRDITKYTIQIWGHAQAISYINEMNVCCQRLAENSELGRIYSGFGPDLRRFKIGKHIIFYRQKSSGIFVSRILHERMLPTLHKLDHLH